MHTKEIHVKNGHKWTRYVALSIVLALAPTAGTLTARATAHSMHQAAVTVAAGDTTRTPAPCGSKWI